MVVKFSRVFILKKRKKGSMLLLGKCAENAHFIPRHAEKYAQMSLEALWITNLPTVLETFWTMFERVRDPRKNYLFEYPVDEFPSVSPDVFTGCMLIKKIHKKCLSGNRKQVEHIVQRALANIRSFLSNFLKVL